MNALLNKLYHDPKTGFIGAQALYQKAQRLDPKITFKVVKDWYASQTDIQRYQDQKKRFNGFKIASYNPNSWQMDLAFWEKRPILTAININSRLGFAKVLSNKTAATVLAALKAFVRLHKVDIITSDNGSEFMNSQAQEFFQSNKIEHYNNEPGDHGTMGKIERFNRTLKQRLTKMPPKMITQKLITDVIENYNTTFHRSIKMTPNEAKGKVMDADLSHNQAEADRIEKEFEVGENVLYRLKKQTFDKESARWSKAVYSIVGIDGYRVQIRSKNGHTLYKAPNDLKMVTKETTDATINRGDILEAEKILNHKKIRSGRPIVGVKPAPKYKYLVRWLGNEPDSWEPFLNLRLVNKNRQSTLEKEYWATAKK
ncbi:integrase core domain containing protein [Plasmopara halstedii]|uniref:Integrase core domain containing protein n=1 Tax=Plasmopara halstedii TaxID=4781 RepID=A0A0P1AXU8_PLAHL|nr:integrase core domain containing protein [Plasmopara halstedii]XP_024583030.1 integrase core domain containing protein [Plasmopara halstedii]CEG41885.1 integrase core domain containing protein [Plasmopara halstedii]CEG46661.1 integrase core domain containing protein [Plasmopara halstedii]|eukprot:XP_024578254.1 integrase core domain containing protein [Plasmopara halstedii]